MWRKKNGTVKNRFFTNYIFCKKAAFLQFYICKKTVQTL